MNRNFKTDKLYAWLKADPMNCRASMKEMAQHFGVSTAKINLAVHELAYGGKIEKVKGVHRNIKIVGVK